MSQVKGFQTKDVWGRRSSRAPGKPRLKPWLAVRSVLRGIPSPTLYLLLQEAGNKACCQIKKALGVAAVISPHCL